VTILALHEDVEPANRVCWTTPDAKIVSNPPLSIRHLEKTLSLLSVSVQPNFPGLSQVLNEKTTQALHPSGLTAGTESSQ
jgi:hypothetical protein